MSTSLVKEFHRILPVKCFVCLRCTKRFALKPVITNIHVEELSVLKKQGNETPQASGEEGKNCCSLCLGILFEERVKKFALQVSQHIIKENFDSHLFSLNVVLPHLFHIRQHSFQLYLKENVRKDLLTTGREVPLKEAFKEQIIPIIELETDKKFSIQGEIQVTLSLSHPDNEKEEKCILSSGLEKKTPKRRKVESKEISWSKLDEALTKLSSIETLSRLYPCPPECCTIPCEITAIRSTNTSVYFAGRYNKFSRTLSQTPWVIDGKRHGDTSVQELVCDPIKETIRADDAKFMSSGREDVDVRMLGDGRPFAVEFINPRKTKLSAEDLMSLQSRINARTKDVKVTKLQLITRDDLKILKEGEEGKSKIYSALIYIPNGVNEQFLESLTSFKNLIIKQKTPIRVLHRRPLAVREKTIHSMSAKSVDDNHILLNLTTQAGTYIKEFVHGDFGRTIPSLGTLIKSETDILELDVLEVDLEWPPDTKGHLSDEDSTV